MAIDTTILDNLQQTVLTLQQSINLSIQQSINSNKDRIRELQTQEQMYQGTDSEGIDIKPAYANSTIKLKEKKFQPTDRVTLFDTGAFYNSLEVVAGKSDMIIRTVISYSVYIVAKYQDVLGLDQESWTKFLDQYTIPIIKNNFDDIITKS